MPALKATTSINSRRGLAPAPSAIKAIMAVPHRSSFASHDRSAPIDGKTNCRRNLQTTTSSQAVRARKPFGNETATPPQTKRVAVEISFHSRTRHDQLYAYLNRAPTESRPRRKPPCHRRSFPQRLNEHSGRGKATRPRRGRGRRSRRRRPDSTRGRQPRPSPRWRAGR